MAIGGKADIHARHGDDAAGPAGEDRLVEREGPLHAHRARQHGGSDLLHQGLGAVALHAHRLDHRVGALAARQLQDGLLHLALGVVDGLGAAFAGQRQPLGQGVDRDDPLRAEQEAGFDRELPDRAAAPDRDRVGRLDLAVVGGHVGGGEDVGQEQHLLVRQPLRDLDRADIGVGHAQILGLAAREAAGDVRVAEQPGEGVAELLGLHLAVRVGALAAGPVAPFALAALAAADGEGHHHAVADLELLVVAADLDHLAHGLVAEHVAALHGGDEAAHQVQVGAADGAGGDLDDGVAAVLDRRIGDAVAADVALAVPSQCLHARLLRAVRRGFCRRPLGEGRAHATALDAAWNGRTDGRVAIRSIAGAPNPLAGRAPERARLNPGERRPALVGVLRGSA